MTGIGERIKYLRENADMSQAALSRMLNLSQQAVAKWESGKSEPDNENVLRIAEIFNVTTDYLLGKPKEVGTHRNERINPLTGGKMTSREKRQMDELLVGARALFFDKEISDRDKDTLLRVMTESYWQAKEMNRRKGNGKQKKGNGSGGEPADSEI